ncbi:hypothetical protein SAMN02745163_00736 [Clostridium cavendishii DSM 21758]|uniref:Uncharacterized protein n=1 Tax=Clostridium cavendishii DSM 21758 TaxID=1121302 RepID=A0A1M6DI76_9CLOT|nr:hypothetical protein [Clostridium cavendishii]SHI72870.1 hypothetical protein SAMN02745163_00736 [Clostridium cavendishii DSM 21758]
MKMIIIYNCCELRKNFFIKQRYETFNSTKYNISDLQRISKEERRWSKSQI